MTALNENEKQQLFQTHDVPRISELKKVSDVRSALIAIIDKLKDLQHRDWEKRIDLLQILEITFNESLNKKSLHRCLNKLFKKNRSLITGISDALIVQIDDRRSEIGKQFSMTLISITKVLKRNLRRILDIIFPELIDRIKIQNQIIREHFIKAAEEILINVEDKGLIYDIWFRFDKTKSDEVGHELGKLLKIALIQWDITRMIKFDKPGLNQPGMKASIRAVIVGCINHKISETRDLGIDLFWIYILNYYFNEKNQFLSKFDERMQEMIEEGRPDFNVHKKSVLRRVSSIFQNKQTRVNQKYKGLPHTNKIVEEPDATNANKNDKPSDINSKSKQDNAIRNADQIKLDVDDNKPKRDQKMTNQKEENLEKTPCCICF